MVAFESRDIFGGHLNRTRVVVFGCTNFTAELLGHLLGTDAVEVCGIVTAPESFRISYSATPVKNYNFADLSPLANHVPWVHVYDKDQSTAMDQLEKKIASSRADLILVLGWYYMVPARIRNLVKRGAWGVHASLLPEYAGGAPLVWAMIHGEQETGTTLFCLGDGVDDGDIILQEKFAIAFTDTIAEVYAKATEASKSMLGQVLRAPDNFPPQPQDKRCIKVFPQRKPADGEIDMKWDGLRVYNFIRAQAPPYPGAFLRTVDGHRIYVDKCRFERGAT